MAELGAVVIHLTAIGFGQRIRSRFEGLVEFDVCSAHEAWMGNLSCTLVVKTYMLSSCPLFSNKAMALARSIPTPEADQ